MTAARVTSVLAGEAADALRAAVALALLGGATFAADATRDDAAARFARDVLPVVRAQCVDCHGAETPEGALDLDRFRSYDDALRDRATWKRVFDAVEAGQMPLRDSGYDLSAAEREALLRFAFDLQAAPDPALAALDPGKPVLRRLTRLEYNNTVRDLFALECDAFEFPERLPIADKAYFSNARDAIASPLKTSMREYGAKHDVLLPKGGLPGDNRAEYGYGNRGDALDMSPLLFEKYLELAEAIARSERLARESVVARRLFGEGTAVALRERVAEFLRRAYRRPVEAREIDASLAQIREVVRSGGSEADGVRRVVQTTLASPDFLFLSEPLDRRAGAVRPLAAHEVASRLSYFLWASMPDDELFRAAEAGELNTPEGLRKQTRRMLADRRRSRELSESFAAQWLRLDQLYSAKPDAKLFQPFYAGPQGKSTLHASMLTEALLLFETVLVEDRSVLELIDSDYTWLNRPMARLYGLEAEWLAAGPTPRDDASGDGASVESEAGEAPKPPAAKPKKAKPPEESSNEWRRVALPDRTRGGVMTMAASLTLTSLPHRTSPVKRGAWLLETVFHRPPAEPKVAFVLEDRPADGVDPSTLTVRKRFERHRSDPNCWSCHSRIDPPGFSLEAFDAIGALRTRDGAEAIDASGVWNDQPFRGPAEFKAALRKREREFVRGFVEHLLSYALGREVAHYDAPAVAKIVDDAAADGDRFSAIVEGVVSSYPFRFARNVAEAAP